MKQAAEKTITRVGLVIALTASLAALAKAFIPRGPAVSASETALFALAEKAVLIGSPNARQTVILATDHQCPYCRDFRDSLALAIADDSLSLNVRILPFPMAGVHPTAPYSAQALVCASQQNQQDQADSALYAIGDSVTHITTGALSARLGISDTSRFVNCLKDPATTEYIETSTLTARAAGAVGTPTIWINGRRLNGVVSMTVLLADE